MRDLNTIIREDERKVREARAERITLAKKVVLIAWVVKVAIKNIIKAWRA